MVAILVAAHGRRVMVERRMSLRLQKVARRLAEAGWPEHAIARTLQLPRGRLTSILAAPCPTGDWSNFRTLVETEMARDTR